MPYRDEYKRPILVAFDESVVVTLERTSVFHVDLAFDTNDCRPVPAGISSWTNEHALAEDIHEMPTREITLELVKL